jgi:hypothetical protein
VVWLPFGVATSVTLMKIVASPSAVGFPPSVPFGVKVRPAGNVPCVIWKVYGGLPPLACAVNFCAFPTVKAGRLSVSMFSGGGGLHRRLLLGDRCLRRGGSIR